MYTIPPAPNLYVNAQGLLAMAVALLSTAHAVAAKGVALATIAGWLLLAVSCPGWHRALEACAAAAEPCVAPRKNAGVEDHGDESGAGTRVRNFVAELSVDRRL